MSQNRHALVTGGAGFIGRPLVCRLMDDGWSVTVLDDFSAGTLNLASAAFDKRPVEIVEADVAAREAVQEVIRRTRPSVVFHLAAMHFIPQCEANPEKTLATNVIGTQAVLSAMAEVPESRLVFASTGDVYAPSTEPHDEHAAVSSITLYGLTKYTSECLIHRAAARGLHYRIARLFNTYGPGDLTPHVLPDILTGLSQGRELALGRLDAVRDYVYVDDVVDGLVRMAGYEGDHRVFNIGTGIGRSVQGILDTLAALLERPISTRTDPAKVRPLERPVLLCNPRRAGEALGWTPATDFPAGLERTLVLRKVLNLR